MLITNKVVSSGTVVYTGTNNECETFVTNQSNDKFVYKIVPMSREELMKYNKR